MEKSAAKEIGFTEIWNLLTEKFREIDERFEQIDQRFESIERTMEHGFAHCTQRINRIEDRIEGTEKQRLKRTPFGELFFLVGNTERRSPSSLTPLSLRS